MFRIMRSYVYGAENYELLEKFPGDDAGEEGFIRQSTNIAIKTTGFTFRISEILM